MLWNFFFKPFFKILMVLFYFMSAETRMKLELIDLQEMMINLPMHAEIKTPETETIEKMSRSRTR